MTIVQKSGRLKRQKFIAFYKGHLISDSILEWILDAARRGKMTQAGANLLLIPDTRQGPADSSGLRHIGKFRKSDCLTLKQLNRRIRQSKALPLKAKKPKNGLQNNKQIKALKTRKMQKTRTGTTASDGYFLHKGRGVNELKSASLQVSS